MGPAIEVTGLTKSYRTRSGTTIEAVRGIDLRVDEGEILAFLGSNGAGKTTTIEILEGFRTRTSGQVRVLGEDPQDPSKRWREDIGIVLQESVPDSDLTARESVAMYASFYDAPRGVDDVLGIVGLTGSADQRTKALSGGQKRRLDLAIALVGEPKLIFLDEPTTELGSTVLLTTHYMDEAEHLADRIVVISDGVIVADGTASALADQVQLRTRVGWDTSEVPVDAVPAAWQGAIRSAERAPGSPETLVVLETTEVTEVVHALTTWALENETRIDSLSVERPSLEDTFLRLSGDPGSAATGTGGDE